MTHQICSVTPGVQSFWDSNQIFGNSDAQLSLLPDQVSPVTTHPPQICHGCIRWTFFQKKTNHHQLQLPVENATWMTLLTLTVRNSSTITNTNSNGNPWSYCLSVFVVFSATDCRGDHLPLVNTGTWIPSVLVRPNPQVNHCAVDTAAITTVHVQPELKG